MVNEKTNLVGADKRRGEANFQEMPGMWRTLGEYGNIRKEKEEKEGIMEAVSEDEESDEWFRVLVLCSVVEAWCSGICVKSSFFSSPGFSPCLRRME
jgi:hypothetical protein